MAPPLLYKGAVVEMLLFNFSDIRCTVITFDLRETLIPFSLLQITNAFRQMPSGEEIEIVAGGDDTDLAVFKDILRILPRTEYELISQEKVTGDDPLRRLRLRKKSKPTPQLKGEPSCRPSI